MCMCKYVSAPGGWYKVGWRGKQNRRTTDKMMDQQDICCRRRTNFLLIDMRSLSMWTYGLSSTRNNGNVPFWRATSICSTDGGSTESKDPETAMQLAGIVLPRHRPLLTHPAWACHWVRTGCTLRAGTLYRLGSIPYPGHAHATGAFPLPIPRSVDAIRLSPVRGR